MAFKKGQIPWNKGKIQLKTIGIKNPNWKGGISKIIGHCPDCGKRLKHYLSKHCFLCSFKYRKNNIVSGEKHYKWKGGLPKCLQCGKEIAYKAKHCSSCSKLGKRNVNWHNGVSFDDYSIDFNSILKWKIRKRDNYKCVICKFMPDKKIKNRLVIHHIDYDKKNCKLENLITLCSKCHNKTNQKRSYWIKFFKEAKYFPL